jgi:hypothetical protein
MKTLATSLPVGNIPRVLSIEKLAELLDVKPAWVHDARRRGVIEPLLGEGYRGELQFARGALVRLAAFDMLKNALGERSSAPAEIVRSVAADLDGLATDPWLDPADMTRAIERGFARVVAAVRDGLVDRLSPIAS